MSWRSRFPGLLAAFVLAPPALLLLAAPRGAAKMPDGPTYTNSIGMRLVRIPAGSFSMGHASELPDALTEPLTYPTRSEMTARFPGGDPALFEIPTGHVRTGDFDERPVHRVTISRPFYMGAHEVTNAQYERFDPAHRELRGRHGFSKEDDEAVVFVSWEEAQAFARWLSEREGLPYRLPTEAEWEYAARAGTTTPFWTGDRLPPAFLKNPRNTTFEAADDVVPLTVGRTPANPWGLFDMHGNVEEWCADWYGPYVAGEQVDPVGRAGGEFRVSRGGSHGTFPYYLRSANRMGTLPSNRHWLIGLRLVLGPPPDTAPLPALPPPAAQQQVRQERPAAGGAADTQRPYFKGPRRYVKIPEGSHGPLFSHHNHDAAITEAPNGDLLAIWYTTAAERGRELAVAASRLRHGQEEWDTASLFWDAPDRNDHCPALWFDGRDTLYHFNGLSTAGMWEPLAIVMRTSKDSGATWSPARLIVPEHGYRQMVGEPVFRMKNGAIAFGADADLGSTIWVSHDEGQTWSDPGGLIHGIHAGIVPLSDGRLLALGRGMNIDGRMPQSISSDGGRTWQASASPFPPLSGGQRPVLVRLREGPLFMASFTDDLWNPRSGTGSARHRTGIFGALSFDDGRTWPVRRFITDASSDRPGETIDGGPIRMGPGIAEPQGYLSVTQTSDGAIQLISSWNHYAFNLAWLRERIETRAPAPAPQDLAARGSLRHVHAAVAPRDEDGGASWRAIGGDGPGGIRDGADGGMRLEASGDRLPRWTNERLEMMTAAEAGRGVTAEIRVQVPRSAGGRGVDLELSLRGSALTVNHYLLTVTADAVGYWYDGRLVEVAANLDNAGAPHTFRLAVRPDTAVQIYRDDTLLGTWPMDLQIDWRLPARGSYIEWGLGDPGATAVVSHVAYDLSGAYRP